MSAVLLAVGSLDRVGQMNPLRRTDPRELGGYTLHGRLGSGGMGVVFLASGPGGAQVAVKMVHAELAGDEYFRDRFRNEVSRLRQVPPFCTAEVLDADPDHDPPFLVVEYVDGPSLAEVVAERGQLTTANLHAVAIGVATALTGIHGAGVIHRDLKPENVLLAPGSPKVIDFGLARAFQAATKFTRTDQMVGTVAYMAPERFDSETDAVLTPAADIFAWGAVVAYAGTGREPFQGDSPSATAARILTQPPKLDGLSGSLRHLITAAVAKDPADRPTAREVLDQLVGADSSGSPQLDEALAGQPDLRYAAESAQAAAATPVRLLDPPPAPLVREPVLVAGGLTCEVPITTANGSPARRGARHARGWSPRRSFAVRTVSLALLATVLVGVGIAANINRTSGSVRLDGQPGAVQPSTSPAVPSAVAVLVNNQTGQCLSNEAARIYVAPCDDTGNQEWESIDARLRNRATGRCLDGNVQGLVYAEPCNTGNFQNWEIRGDGTVIGLETGLCLDNNDAGEVYTLPCNAGEFQVWRH
jgi:hypothetical protein